MVIKEPFLMKFLLIYKNMLICNVPGYSYEGSNNENNDKKDAASNLFIDLLCYD